MGITTIRDRLGFSFPPSDLAAALPVKGARVNPRRRALFLSQHGHCYYCGKETPFYAWTIEHKIPASRGGRGSKNTVGACSKCNGAKGDLTEEEFRKVLAGEPRPTTPSYRPRKAKSKPQTIIKVVAVRPSPVLEPSQGDMRDTRLRVFKARTTLDWQHYNRPIENGRVRPLSHDECRKVHRKYDKRQRASYANPFTDL